jgi:hypothetical protein
MATYLDQLRRLKTLRLKAIAPGHGHVIADIDGTVDRLVDHRLLRESIVEAALREHGPATTLALVPEVYSDVAEERHEMARHSRWAHLR